MRLFKFAAILICCAIGSANGQEALTELEIFHRCYMRLTRLVPPDSDSILVAVRQGTKTATAGCLELFDRARLGSDGILVNRQNASARAIMRTFQDIHNSWFQVKKHGFSAVSMLINDNEEPALYFTRAVLLPSTQFKTVLTLDHGLAGVRDTKTYPDEGDAWKVQRIQRYPGGFPFSGEDDLILSYDHSEVSGTGFTTRQFRPLRIPDQDLVEFGALVGIKQPVPLKFPSFRSPPTNSTEFNAAAKQTLVNFDAKKHFGGGVLGSQGFLITNTNLTTNQIANSYDVINRRLTNRIFEDLLCQRLPSLTDADVASEVIPTSPHGFQRTSSCMRCHSSMDGMAFGFRRFYVYRSSPFPQLGGQETGLNLFGMAALPDVTGATHFALQSPVGRLHYRELLTGTLRKSEFTSVAQLGQQLSNHNDFYTCAAKRYYQHMTGVDVDLWATATRPVDLQHQNKVRELGQQLKSHQSVRTLLRDIISSEAFRTRNFKTMVAD